MAVYATIFISYQRTLETLEVPFPVKDPFLNPKREQSAPTQRTHDPLRRTIFTPDL